MSHKLFLLPGDGIGVEVMGEVEKLIAWLNKEQKAFWSSPKKTTAAKGKA